MSDLSDRDIDQAKPSKGKHGRSSSSDQGKPDPKQCPASPIEAGDIIRSIEPSSPSRPKSATTEKPKSKRPRKSSTASERKSRPTYSRKYSTPPSRPLSPSGYPRLLDADMAIPEIDLNQASHHLLCVDSAPQEPDIWEDPETDYFSTIEGPPGRHARAKSRRQLSQSMNSLNQQLNAMANPGSLKSANPLTKITENDADVDFLLPPTPGAFA